MTPLKIRPTSTRRLYWAMRLSMAFIWLWTAVVSWFFYPQNESIEWLKRLGLVHFTFWIFAGACMLDFVLGVVSVVRASGRLWQFQFLIVAFYSVAIAIALPEFLIHPFGPLIKNAAVLACLAYLTQMEKKRITNVLS